jgi:hypothetical protein
MIYPCGTSRLELDWSKASAIETSSLRQERENRTIATFEPLSAIACPDGIAA